MTFLDKKIKAFLFRLPEINVISALEFVSGMFVQNVGNSTQCIQVQFWCLFFFLSFIAGT